MGLLSLPVAGWFIAVTAPPIAVPMPVAAEVAAPATAPATALPAAFATAHVGGRPAGFGLAGLDRGAVGLFVSIVRPDVSSTTKKPLPVIAMSVGVFV